MPSKNYLKTQWSCPHKCDLSEGKICIHLAKLLPYPDRGKMPIASEYEKRNLIYLPQEESYEDICIKVEDLLGRYGSTKAMSRIISAKLFDKKTWEDIVREQNFTSIGSARYFFNKSMKYLKNRGFKLNEKNSTNS